MLGPFEDLSWTHALAPGQPGGVVLLDVVLQLRPDGDVGLHPVQMGLVPVRERQTVYI